MQWALSRVIAIPELGTVRLGARTSPIEVTFTHGTEEKGISICKTSILNNRPPICFYTPGPINARCQSKTEAFLLDQIHRHCIGLTSFQEGLDYFVLGGECCLSKWRAN